MVHCESVRETQGWYLLNIEGILGQFITIQEKQILSRAYWDIKRKLVVTTHLTKIIKIQFGKKCPALFCILNY